MKNRVTFLRHSLLLLVLLLGAVAAMAQVQSPAHWSYSVRDLNDSVSELRFTAQLDAGWHLYSQHTDPAGPLPIVFEFVKGSHYRTIGPVSEPKPHEEYDDMFKCTVRSFSGKVTFVQKVQRLTTDKSTIRGTLSYQLCNDGSCIPPDDVDFTFTVSGAAAPSTPTADTSAADTALAADSAATPGVDTAATSPAATPADGTSSDTSLLWAFLVALAGGVLTMFTPCVFPMIPMTVNFFMHNGDNKRKGRRQAWYFGFSIVFLFAVLGAVLALVFGPESLYFIGVHWLPNLIFFIIFLVFSLSFFGLFEIKMPEKWINKSDEQADKGGFFAPFFIALTTVLVSFSCTGPILGAALVGLSTSTTDRWISLVSMTGFGIGFAAPFTLLAMFPQALKNMKSGSWLNTVKVVFAFLELAFGLKFLSMADQYCGWRILDREVYLALWIVIFALMGFYLLGKIMFKGDSEVKQLGVVRLFLAIVTFSFVVYMVPGMWGAPLKTISGFLPPMETQDFNLARHQLQAASASSAVGTLPADRKYADKLHAPDGYEAFYALDEAKAFALKVGKPIFIDFTGKTCANCREMEHYVWADEQVFNILSQKFVMCALYADENTIDLPENEWVTDEHGKVLKTLGRRNLWYQKTQFNMNAQPYYVIIDAQGRILTAENYKYDRDVAKFIAYLNEGLANYGK